MEKFTLKGIRAQREMTQAEIAEKMGVTIAAVSVWEKNKGDMSARQFAQLCDIYNVSRDDILLPTISK